MKSGKNKKMEILFEAFWEAIEAFIKSKISDFCCKEHDKFD